MSSAAETAIHFVCYSDLSVCNICVYNPTSAAVFIKQNTYTIYSVTLVFKGHNHSLHYLDKHTLKHNFYIINYLSVKNKVYVIDLELIQLLLPGSIKTFRILEIPQVCFRQYMYV